MVSIICPVYNEEKFIKNCIDSILAQDYPLDDIEVLFVDGNSTDNTVNIINGYIKEYHFIKAIQNPDKIAPAAMNLGIKFAKGDIIIRLDGHCVYPENYITVLVNKINELEADNVGTLINTIPAKNTAVCRAIAIGMSHVFGVGNSYFRIGCTEIIEVDTVPFGCFRREIFDKIGLFDNELIRNQDDEFNARIKKNGGKIFLIPEIRLDYYARDTIGKMSRMFYQYGLFKPLVNKKVRKPATLRQFIPFFFLLGMFFGAITIFFSGPLFWLYMAGLFSYGSISLFFSMKESLIHKEIKLIYLLPYVFFIIHVSYGYGYLKGIYKLIFNKKIQI